MSMNQLFIINWFMLAVLASLRRQLYTKVETLVAAFALQTQYSPNHGAARLAIVDYAPDGKSVSGTDNWR